MPPAFVLSQDQTLNLTPPAQHISTRPNSLNGSRHVDFNELSEKQEHQRQRNITVQHQTRHLRPNLPAQPRHTSPAPNRSTPSAYPCSLFLNQLCQIAAARQGGGGGLIGGAERPVKPKYDGFWTTGRNAISSGFRTRLTQHLRPLPAPRNTVHAGAGPAGRYTPDSPNRPPIGMGVSPGSAQKSTWARKPTPSIELSPSSSFTASGPLMTSVCA